ncbi:hypothetical protein [Streptomyces sp. H51]|uniref:hypothetical protein n=1 Tax=Streptomyces sp. H51 TaxID=3111770 RepID=UPI002D767A4A|nr:hypothetical protein [Streptomyces sp. H51]
MKKIVILGGGSAGVRSAAAAAPGHPVTPVFTTGFERTVLRTGEVAEDVKAEINTERIRPPVDDAQTLPTRADPRSARAS